MKESTKRILEMPSSMTCKEVAQRLGLSYGQVIWARKNYNVDYARKRQGKVTDYALMWQMIEQGVSYKKIGDHFGVCAQSIRHHAAKIGHSRVAQWPEEAIADDYAKGLPIKRLETKYGCSNQTIYSVIERQGAQLRRRSHDIHSTAA